MLTITVDDKDLRALFARLLEQADDLTPAMGKIGDVLESRVSARFETERDPLGQGWTEWEPSTQKTYPKDGHGRILDRTGERVSTMCPVYTPAASTPPRRGMKKQRRAINSPPWRGGAQRQGGQGPQKSPHISKLSEIRYQTR